MADRDDTVLPDDLAAALLEASAPVTPDADAAKRMLELKGKTAYPAFDLVPQAQNIPMSMTPDNNRLIGKAVNFF